MLIRERRLDIQGLRALAVTLVVVFHLWPKALPGGYVGVDVFFVISGFLITSHLLSEVSRSGTVSVTRFWARRIRRLLPAAFLVLAVCVVLAFLVMPRSVLVQNLEEIAASALYVVNWVLAFNAVDYLASENADSLVQHYWSLSVEEQFYIVWPVLIVVASFLAVKVFRGRRVAVIAGTLGTVFLASFVYSVWETAADPSFAYFITPTRAWEFAAGGLIAFLPALRAGSAAGRIWRRVGSWVGVGLIGAAAWCFTGDTPFPGWVALIPVAGAAFLLWSGDDDHPWSPQYLSHHGPVQLVGDTSYAIYLWHWPLIIIAPIVLGHPIGLGTGLGIIAITVGLAIATKYLVEDPVRTARGRWRLRWPAYSFMAVGMVFLVAFAPITIATQRVQAAAADARIQTIADDDCLGAPAMDPATGCAWSQGDFITPSPDNPVEEQLGLGCMTDHAESELKICDFGVDAETAVRTIALVGDSHAAVYVSAMEEIAMQEGWHLVTMLKASCPFTEAVRKGKAENSRACVEWNAAAADELQRRPEIDAIVTSASSKNPFVSEPGQSSYEAGVQGYLAAWNALPPTVDRILVVRDVPRHADGNIECLTKLPDVSSQLEYAVCSTPRDEALLPDPAAGAAQEAADRASEVDLTELFCDDDACLSVIGNVLAYRDSQHLTRAFAQSLVPYLRKEIEGLHASG